MLRDGIRHSRGERLRRRIARISFRQCFDKLKVHIVYLCVCKIRLGDLIHVCILSTQNGEDIVLAA